MNWHDAALRLHAHARTTEEIMEAIAPLPIPVREDLEEASACLREAARRLALLAAGKVRD
jgi:hypothetical protein